MALSLLCAPQRVSLLLLLSLLSFVSARALETVDHAPELTCSEGLTDCRVSSASPFAAGLPDPDDTVNVKHVQLKVILCCSAAQDCEPCLQIIITIQEVHHAQQASEESGAHIDEEEFSTNQLREGSGQPVIPESGGLVTVCLSSPGSTDICKALQFKSSYSSLDQQPTHKLLLTERVMFGSPVVVHVDARSNGANNIQNITVPSLEEVCSMNLEGTVKECDAPRLRAVTDRQRNLVVLQLENTDARQDEIMCQMVWNEMSGEVLAWVSQR